MASYGLPWHTGTEDGLSLKLVADKADVSLMTVSRVLNCKGYVAAETRRRVLAASRELGVFPRNLGRRSSRHAEGDVEVRRRVVVLIDTDISSFFLSDLLVSLQRALASHGFDCLMQTFTGEHSDFLHALSGIRPSVASGCLAVGQFTDSEAQGILDANPLTVFVDFIPGPSLDLPIQIVSYDNVAAARMAVRQLVACGCRRIVCMQGTATHHFSRAMREGCLSALDRSEFEKGGLSTSDFTSNGAYHAMKAALESPVRPDGLFTTDEMAFGAVRAIKEAGLSIPEDIKVMGCDGMDLGRELTPPLSTVILDRKLLSERAVSRAVSLIKQPDQPIERVLLTPRLEIRGTCVPPH